MYEERFYRRWVNRGSLEQFEVHQGESDLLILCDLPLQGEAQSALAQVREDLETYLARDPAFGTSLEPYQPQEQGPAVVQAMASWGQTWGVGPMAAVAGAVAHWVGKQLLATGAETVFVENGGDVFVRAPRLVRFALYAGEGSPFSDKVAFQVDASQGVGVCTSSGRVGPSLSMGQADAVVALAHQTAEADAAATSLANRIQGPADIDSVVELGRTTGSLQGLLACAGDRLGLWGDFELIRD
jgi:ApbE superfamily uncharacterized protein (UPF0280 family)